MLNDPKKRCRKCANGVKAPVITMLVMVKIKGNKNARPRPMMITKKVKA